MFQGDRGVVVRRWYEAPELSLNIITILAIAEDINTPTGRKLQGLMEIRDSKIERKWIQDY